jgi:hypothetical protein
MIFLQISKILGKNIRGPRQFFRAFQKSIAPQQPCSIRLQAREIFLQNAHY